MTGGRRNPTLRSLDALADAGLISAADVSALARVEDSYAIALSPIVADLVRAEQVNQHGDHASPGPIARQYLPDTRELNVRDDERADPIGDAAHSPVPHIVHRYHDRALLKPVSVCPVYCRFCFRREAVGPGKSAPARPADLDAAFDYVASHPEIWEVIVTGGDPLVLSAAKIAEIGTRLSRIDHVKVIRWHTRVPVAAPDMVTDKVAAALAVPLAADRMVYASIHTNHATELTASADTAIRRMRSVGLVLVSQTVLLRGVNDTAEALAALMRGLVQRGVKPYYLHQLDRAPGTSHFEVPLDEARALVQQLRGDLSGLCQPTFVIDIPGGEGKALAANSDVATGGDLADESSDAADALVRGRDGRWHRYRTVRAEDERDLE